MCHQSNDTAPKNNAHQCRATFLYSHPTAEVASPLSAHDWTHLVAVLIIVFHVRALDPVSNRRVLLLLSSRLVNNSQGTVDKTQKRRQGYLALAELVGFEALARTVWSPASWITPCLRGLVLHALLTWSDAAGAHLFFFFPE